MRWASLYHYLGFLSHFTAAAGNSSNSYCWINLEEEGGEEEEGRGRRKDEDEVEEDEEYEAVMGEEYHRSPSDMVREYTKTSLALRTI